MAIVRTANDDRGAARRLGYRPVLDGLRAIAIVLILLTHTSYGTPIFPGGFIGLDIFLALSGFLITSLLIEEWEASGHISLGSFYARRALRIFPAFFALVLVYTAGGLLRATGGLRSSMLSEAAAAATYRSNFILAGGHHMSSLAHTWSLSFEEQFYALWPVALILLIALTRSRRAVMLVTAVAIAGVTGLRLYLWARGAPWERTYFGPDTRADALLVGCLASQVYYWTRYAERFRRGLRVGAGAVALVLIPFVGLVHVEWRVLAAGPMTLVAMAMGSFILGTLVSAPRSLQLILEHRTMRVMGRLSYSLYLWHVPIFVYLADVYPGRLPLPNLPTIAKTALAFGLTFAAATASYFVVELPFLRLKRKFTRIEKPPIEEAALRPGEVEPASSTRSV